MMADSLKVEIKGARELDELLKQLPDRVAKQVLAGALMSGGQVIRAEIQRRAPVRHDAGAKKIGKGAKGRLPGFLRASIARRRIRRGSAALTIGVGPLRSAFYAMFQEFGTRHQPARPFMRPAFDAKAGEALQKIGEALGRGIDRAAARLAKGRSAGSRR